MTGIVRYDVYDNSKTDFPILIYGTAKECAKALGVSIWSFYNIVYKTKKGKNTRIFAKRSQK